MSLTRQRIEIEGVTWKLMTWRERHEDVRLLSMLLSNKVGDIGESGKTISLVFVSSEGPGNKIATERLHLQAMGSLFSQCFHILRLLPVDLVLALPLSLLNEVHKGANLFLYDFLSDMIILRLDVLSERLVVLNLDRSVATCASVGFG